MDPIAFGIVAACLLSSALFVVLSKNLVHAVLWLAVTLATTAALFVLLQAPFLAGIQILLYTGGVITLMLFGVMLTRRHERLMIENESTGSRRVPGVLAGSVLFGVVAAAIYRTPGLPTGPGRMVATQEIGHAFLTEHLLAFEVLSILLLIAMIGAIVLARKADFGAETERVMPVRGRKAT
ncbi:MAG: NADH-quinone oxidoreductase subunit J [Myxococcales bacterium]|nr:NADH-quinone oxidoreductase subunit J [Myxococcales bacterium]